MRKLHTERKERKKEEIPRSILTHTFSINNPDVEVVAVNDPFIETHYAVCFFPKSATS